MGVNRISRRVIKINKSESSFKASVFEHLENRALLSTAAPVITSFTADNRGQVILHFSQKMDIHTIGRGSVHILGVGADGQINTADDAALTISMELSADGKTLIATAPVAADANYRVKLSGSIIKGINGINLDGEFNASGNSGNGVAGGDFQFRAKRSTGITTHPLAIIRTTEGDMLVQLRADAAPNTVANFKHYADLGSNNGYDGTIIHRNNVAEFTAPAVPPYTFLGAGQYLSTGTQITQLGSPPTVERSTLHNNRGTIATATGPISSNNTNLEPSGFIFNITQNNEIDPNNGIRGTSQVGATAFGTIISSLDPLLKAFKLPTTAFTGGSTSFKGAPSITEFDGSKIRVTLTRVAMLDRVVSLT
ncbi:MAG TPA: peptidylprolyl isomerase [Tepidisphaeraceae bacterium]|nr:peptidylprolyl isomerase [Tepidisphaeraceae bacterium]